MDWVTDEWHELTFNQLLSYMASAGIIFGGVVPYIPQYKQIKENLDIRYFWQWTDFTSYIECLATFTVFSGLLMYLLIDVSVFVETVGFLSVFIEALLGAPQLIKNHKNKSTAGMSKLMVFLWTFGDVFKTTYFLVRRAPIQFWICGLLQVSIDLFIFGQILFYRKPYKKVSKAYIH